MGAEIQTQTPDEMLRDAYNRCIKCGEYMTKDWPLINFVSNFNVRYTFEHAPKEQYIFMYKREDNRYQFKRVSDAEPLILTKYGVRPTIL